MSDIQDEAVETIGRMFGMATEADPTRPLITYYDGETGERTELSGTSLANWVAKTANLLVDDAGLGPGATAAVVLPPHWQSAAVLLGCFTAGVAVTLRPGRTDAAFTTPDRADPSWSAPERYLLGLEPMARPVRDLPDGWADFVVEVRTAGDRFSAAVPVTGDTTALIEGLNGPAHQDRPAHQGREAHRGREAHQDREASGNPGRGGRTHRDACAEALQRARAARLHRADRLLLDAEALPDPMDWLLTPLAAGATIVLCRRCDAGHRQRIRAEEGVTR